jgi:hypothetical protein
VQPLLVVSIDTEEEGLWSGRYRASQNSCRNVERLPRVHAVFERLGVIPTYLVDYPVAADHTAGSILRELAAGGRGEIGAHLHPWCTPPLYPGGEAPRRSFPCRLPPWQQEAKLETLCRAIELNLGARPTSYRAGRWGFDHTTVPVLEKLGILVDSSVNTLWWQREDGGPYHAPAPQVPYRLGQRDVCRSGSSGVVEVPVNRVVVGSAGVALEPIFRRAPPVPGLRWVMCRLGLRSLSVEEHSLGELREVVDTMAARGLPVFNVTFHSSAVLPGASPYVRDERELDGFVARLEALLEHVRGRHGAASLGLSAVAARFGLEEKRCVSAS